MARKKNGKKVYVITIQDATLRIAAYSVVFFFLAAGIFSGISNQTQFTSSASLELIIYLLTLVIHEYIHGLAFWLFGGKVKYGVGLAGYVLPYAYATAEDQPFSLGQMMVVGLSPFIVLCSLSALVTLLWPATAPYAGVVFVGNFAGAVGDLWLLSKLAHFKGLGRVTVVDNKTAMSVYSSDQRASSVASGMKARSLKSNPVNRFLGEWIVASAVVASIALALPVLLGMVNFSGHFILGPSHFALLEITSAKAQASFTFNYLPAVAAGFIFSGIKELIR